MLIGPRFAAAIAQQSRLNRDVAELNTQISTQKRLQQASDDPVAASRIAAIAKLQASETTWLANVESASALALRVDAGLGEANAMMDQATELVTLARTGTATPADRATAASQLRDIAADLRAIMARTDSRGQPLFPQTAALEVPVGKGRTLAATTTRDDAFGPAGASLADLAEAAAAALESGDSDAMGSSLSALQAAQDRLADVRGEQGVRMTRIDGARDQLIASATAMIEERSGLEDTDITEATPRLQAKMLTLEAAQAAFARINRRTLFDLLG